MSNGQWCVLELRRQTVPHWLASSWETSWTSALSSCSRCGQITALANCSVSTLTFFNKPASHHWWWASWTKFGARIGWVLLLSWGFTPRVLAVGLHGAETWTLLKEDSCRLQAFHMTCPRRILGVRWNDFITNRAVADSTNLPSILSTIVARHHSFFGHICRLPANTPAHNVSLQWIPGPETYRTTTGIAPLVDHRLHGWVRLCGTPDLLLLPTHGLLPTTGQRGGHYTHSRLCAAVIEWVSECLSSLCDLCEDWYRRFVILLQILLSTCMTTTTQLGCVTTSHGVCV